MNPYYDFFVANPDAEGWQMMTERFESLREVIAQFRGGNAALKALSCDQPLNKTDFPSFKGLFNNVSNIEQVLDDFKTSDGREISQLINAACLVFGIESITDVCERNVEALTSINSNNLNRLLPIIIDRLLLQVSVAKNNTQMAHRSYQAMSRAKMRWQQEAMAASKNESPAKTKENESPAKLKEQLVQAWRTANEHKKKLDMQICELDAVVQKFKESEASAKGLKKSVADKDKTIRRIQKELEEARKTFDADLNASNQQKELLNLEKSALTEKVRDAERRVSSLQSRLSEVECKVECAICNERDVDVVFHCGHTMCRKCSEDVYARGDECPFCRRRIGYRKKLCLGA